MKVYSGTISLRIHLSLEALDLDIRLLNAFHRHWTF